jgi:2-haloacid dehalogenase
LTNGSAEPVGALVAGAGLDAYVQRNLSVDAVRRWKPAPDAYQWAAQEMGVEPSRVALVATHPWDCAGD